MAQFRGVGRTINHVVAGSAVAAGDAVVVGTLVGVAESGGPVGAKIALTIEGVFEFVAAAAITAGAVVYLTAEGKATTASSGNTKMGVAVSGAETGAAVLVKLN